MSTVLSVYIWFSELHQDAALHRLSLQRHK